MKNTITLTSGKSLRSKKNRRLIARLLRAGFTLRLSPAEESARFDRR